MLEIALPRSPLSFEQSKILVDIMKSTMLEIWNGEITDPINIFNQFLTFSELDNIIQGFSVCGGGITSVPLDFNVPKEYYYHCKLFRAINRNEVTLVAFSDEEICGL